MKNLSVNKIDNSNPNDIIGNLNEGTINYLMDKFGEIPCVVYNIEQVPINDPIFNKPTISPEDPIAKVLPWLPRFIPELQENKPSNKADESTSKISYPSSNYNIIYLDDSLKENTSISSSDRIDNLSINYKANNYISLNSQYLNPNKQKSLEEILPQYNSGFNNSFPNNNQINSTYSLEAKIRTPNSTYYIPAKKLYQRNYF